MSIYITTKDSSRTFYFTFHDELLSIELYTDTSNVEQVITEYSYSIDEITWSDFTEDYNAFLIAATTDHAAIPIFIKIKLSVKMLHSLSILSSFELIRVTINNTLVNVDYIEMSESSCDILTTTNTTNLLNPYRKSAQQDILVKKISKSISDIFGFDVTYFRTDAVEANYTFQTYTLSNVTEVNTVRVVIKDNDIPDNKTRFAEFDIDFQDELELHIVKEVFESVFQGKIPNANDFLFLPLTNRMYQINTVYDLKEFMNESTFYKLLLVKYEDRASIVKSENIMDQLDAFVMLDDIYHEEDIANDKENAVKSFNDIKHDDSTNHISDESLSVNGHQHFRWSFNYEDRLNTQSVLEYNIKNVQSNQYSSIFWCKVNTTSNNIFTINNELLQNVLSLRFDTSTNVFITQYTVENHVYSLSTTNIDNADVKNQWLGVVVNYIFENGSKMLSVSIFNDKLELIQEVADTSVLQLSKIHTIQFYGSQHYANIRLAKTFTKKSSMSQILSSMLPDVNDFYVIDNATPQIKNI